MNERQKNRVEKYEVLVKADLAYNVEEQKIAMIRRVAVTKDKNGNFFLSVVMSDRYGKSVYANMFEIEATDGFQRQLEQLIGRVALVHYTTNMYKGRIALNIVSPIQPIEPEDAYILEKMYFRAAYPETREKKCTSFVNACVDKIHQSRLRTVLKQRCPIEQLSSCADSSVYDGMLGGPFAMISGMLVAANGVVSSQPDYLSDAEIDLLTAVIVYCEFNYAKAKPLHAYETNKWQVQLMNKINADRKLAEIESEDEVLTRFFDICENVVWQLAGVDVCMTSIGKIYVNLRRCVEGCHRVIEITHELPGDSAVSIGQKSYTR